MATDQVKLFFEGVDLSMFGGLPTFEDSRQAASTSKPGKPDPHDSTEKAPGTPDQKSQANLARLGQLMLRPVQRFQPLAPRVVGGGSQMSPILHPQFQIDPRMLGLLSSFMGGR